MPFLVLAISPDNVMVMQGTITKDGLKMLAADLPVATEEANDGSMH